ncbi:glycerol-3-phosphate acyltransferase [Metallumcola ferriviriculae]|uniref:Glycerol-3-phosphate acyltransferase n=1 Tax=Metallumcola ferriviriculae TaxID=3039180 RepID=A0AAU0UQI9_9FIRM|nr:glycerol-3-phosphate acyltransferase [Desulfitibacteraceae bacterium MK1]
MPEFFLFSAFAALIGALPVKYLFLQIKNTPLLKQNEGRLTVKDLITHIGFEMIALITVLELIKGLLVAVLALNFWTDWQWMAAWGILSAILVEQITHQKFRQKGLPLFCGGLLVVAPAMLKIFLALWLSLLILSRNLYLAQVAAAALLMTILYLSREPNYLVFLTAGYLAVSLWVYLGLHFKS